MQRSNQGSTGVDCLPHTARITVHPCAQRGAIAPWLYGHFLEHILSSVDGGLHAELLAERRFRLAPLLAQEELERLPQAAGVAIESGDWRAAGPELLQISYEETARAWIGTAPAGGGFSVHARILRVRGHAGGGIVLERETGAQVCCSLNGFVVPPQVLERGTPDGGGVRATEPSILEPGHNLAELVEIGRWVDVRIDVCGRRLQWHINGVLRHDVELGAGGWRRIGLESAKTQVAFADVSVMAADGRVCGDVPPQNGPALYALKPAFGWEPLEGRCRFARCEEDGRSYLRIMPDGEAAGIRQGPLAVRVGETLRCTMLARAQTRGVTLRAGMRARGSRHELVATVISGIADMWSTVECTLAAAGTCDDAEFFLIVHGGTCDVTDVSLLPAAAGWPPLRRDVLEAVRALRPTIIRWPGGCFAWVYDWKNAMGPRAQRGVTPMYDWTATGGTESNDFGTDEFIAFCRLVGAEPLLVINMNLGVQHALDWLEYCNGGPETAWGARRAANGHPQPYHVRCWSIDNERWAYGAEEYARRAQGFVQAMRARQPDALIWLVGSNLANNTVFGDRPEHRFGADVVRRAPGCGDYISLHNYWGRCTWEELSIVNLRIEAHIEKELAAYRTTPGAGREMIALDEWNPGTTDYQSGIGAALLLNTLERCCGAVGMAAPALWLRHVKHQDAWDNALINFDHRGWFPSVTYLVNKLWSEQRCPELVGAEIDAPNIEACRMQVPVIDAVATTDAREGRLVVKLVNRDATRHADVSIAVRDDAYDGVADVIMLAHPVLDGRNTLEQPHTIAPQRMTADVHGGTVCVRLPPVSACVVALKKGN